MHCIFHILHLVDSPVSSMRIEALNLYPDRSIDLPESIVRDVLPIAKLFAASFQ
jgi:hypothetical protein